MAGVDSLDLPSTAERESSFNDEKINEKGVNHVVELTHEVDMYDDSRAIDLGADGKERPIGRLSS